MSTATSKRAQNRQQKNFQKRLESLKTSSQTSSASSENLKTSSPDSAPELASLSLTPEMMEALNQMSDQEMEQLAALGQKLQPNLTLLSSQNEPTPSSPRSRRKKSTGSGDDGSAEVGSELLAPLSGKHLRQEKELKSLAGAVCLGLVAAAKTSGSQALLLDAQTIAKYGEEVSHAWAVLGRRYTWLYEILDKLCAGSMLAVVLAPMSAMISEIASNHGYTIPGLKLSAA